MKLNFKAIVVGGLAMYVAQWALSMITGPLIHEGVLTEPYTATASFWRPELVQQPPDMAALMPRWITVGLIISLVIAGIYGNLRSAFDGSPLVKGAKFGFVVFLITACMSAAWSGVFNLPEVIWLWWSVENLAANLIGGAVLGLVFGKLAPGDG